jgi:hypothetical protein
VLLSSIVAGVIGSDIYDVFPRLSNDTAEPALDIVADYADALRFLSNNDFDCAVTCII